MAKMLKKKKDVQVPIKVYDQKLTGMMRELRNVGVNRTPFSKLTPPEKFIEGPPPKAAPLPKPTPRPVPKPAPKQVYHTGKFDLGFKPGGPEQPKTPPKTPEKKPMLKKKEQPGPVAPVDRHFELSQKIDTLSPSEKTEFEKLKKEKYEKSMREYEEEQKKKKKKDELPEGM